MADRAKRSHQIDKGEQEYAKSLTTKQAIGRTLLLGGATMKGYAQNRAISKAKGYDPKGSKLTDALESWYGGSVKSRERKAGYIREGENRRGLNAAAHRAMERSRAAAAEAGGIAADSYNKAKKNYKKTRRG